MGNNILYVEDNPDNMMLVQRALEARGYRLLKAVNGLSGVETAEREQEDLILLDINLPGTAQLKDGIAICQHIRSQSDVPIILLTQRGEENDKKQAT